MRLIHELLVKDSAYASYLYKNHQYRHTPLIFTHRPGLITDQRTTAFNYHLVYLTFMILMIVFSRSNSLMHNYHGPFTEKTSASPSMHCTKQKQNKTKTLFWFSISPGSVMTGSHVCTLRHKH